MAETSDTSKIPKKGEKTRAFLNNILNEKRSHQEQISAERFLEVWKYYDRDANRFLDEDEIRRFLYDLVSSTLAGKVPKESLVFSQSQVDELYNVFMDEFDENRDGKISMRELIEILPVEEAFLVLFRGANERTSHINYMKLWRKYDTDGSGYMELDELKNFIRDLIKSHNIQFPNEKKLDEYARALMKLLNVNNDGKLGLIELMRILPERKNFVKLALEQAAKLRQLKKSDIEKLLNHYDEDNSGTLEGDELSDLVRDVLDTYRETGHYEVEDVDNLKRALLEACDADNDGRLDRKELSVALLAIANSGISAIYQFADKKHRSNIMTKSVPDSPEPTPKSSSSKNVFKSKLLNR